MRNEDQLRSTLLLLECETPGTETVLRQVSRRVAASEGRRQPGHMRRPGRQLLTSLSAAAAVIAVTATALALTSLTGERSPAPPGADAALHSVPPYYLILPTASPYDGLIKSTLTGKTLAIIRRPAGVTFAFVSAAADDRTFVLLGFSPTRSGYYSRLYVARFDPADRKARLTRLDVPAVRQGPNVRIGQSEGIAGVAISPDGSRVAVAIDDARLAQIKIYSLANGKARTWEDTAPVIYPLTTLDGHNLLTWAADGLLAFGWSYVSPAIPVGPQGVRLLNTTLRGSGLIADSKAFCLPEENGEANYGQYLTANGRQIIVPVNAPVKIGQRPARCATEASTTLRGSRPAIEEFSVSTGRATAILGEFNWRDPKTLAEQENLWWSNPSGSVLVVPGPDGSGIWPTLGVLRHGRFTPLPRAIQTGFTVVAF